MHHGMHDMPRADSAGALTAAVAEHGKFTMPHATRTLPDCTDFDGDADVAAVSQVPVQMWQGVSPVPVQMWQGVSPVPVPMWLA